MLLQTIVLLCILNYGRQERQATEDIPRLQFMQTPHHNARRLWMKVHSQDWWERVVMMWWWERVVMMWWWGGGRGLWWCDVGEMGEGCDDVMMGRWERVVMMWWWRDGRELWSCDDGEMGEGCDDGEWKENFWMSQRSFYKLCNIMETIMKPCDPTVQASVSLAMRVLYKPGSCGEYCVVANQFGK